MRKFAKLLIPALLLIAIVVSCTLMFASAADEKVIYVAAEAKGDGSGSSPENAMGHGVYSGTIRHTKGGVITDKTFDNAPYQEVVDYIYTLDYGTVRDQNAMADRLFRQSVLYKAFNALAGNGGTIVIMEELGIEVMTQLDVNAHADNDFPASSKTVTLTSNYGDVDYRTQGAKFVLDQSKWNNMLLDVGCPIVMKDLNVEHRYTTKYTQSIWEQGFTIYARGCDFTVDTGVTVTSLAYDGDMNVTPGTVYPNIFAGRRWENATTDSVITIKSGTWRGIFASGHGNTSAYPASVTGDVTINVEGGTVEAIHGGGSVLDNRNFTRVNGNLAVNVTGGKVGTITAATSAGVTGDVDITVTAPGRVSVIVPNTKNATANSMDVKYDAGYVDEIKNPDVFDSVEPPFVVTTQNVVYVSANGTGDGKTPDNPIGNAAGYRKGEDDNGDPNNVRNALYRAADALKDTGGVIVIVGDVYLDTASSRNPSDGKTKIPGEMRWPSVVGSLTFTSVYDGVDYAAKNGAKLVLDYATSHTTNLAFTSNVTFENLDIVYRYKSDFPNAWDSTFMLCANGYKMVIGDNVDVSSFDVTKNVEGDRYPTLVGGHRWENITRNPVITVNSGTWETVIGGGYGTDPSGGKVSGNATITINGGTIGSVLGTGSEKNPYSTVTKAVTITVNGGTIDRLYAANKYEYLGTGSVVTLGKDATIGFADYAVKGYTGNLDDLKSRVTFVNNNTIEVGKAPAVPPTVVYIASNGTGDGSSPESPLGNAPGYKDNLQKMNSLLKSVGGFNNISKLAQADQTFIRNLYKDNVLYRAFELANKKDTVIVLVGDVALDLVVSRMPYREGEKLPPSEFNLPASSYNVTITSVYGGKDYRNQAKLVLDLDACNTTFLTFKSATTIENINIEHKYDDSDKNSLSTPFVFAANGNEFVIGENVNVTAFDTKANAVGDWYPGIIGGHRYENITANTNVTIKSGTWSFVNAGSFGLSDGAYGKITGSATLNIEGGRIEAVYGTSSFAAPTASITKKLTINVTGGFVEVLYATAKNGAKNEIEVNIAATAERVAKAWGGTSDSNIPANATITYDRSVIRDDEVKYWSTVNVNGKVEDQPEPYVFTLYVANVSKGKGDGSSPENAMGHAEGYDALRKQALAIIAANGGTNSGLTADQKAITGAVYKNNALYRALSYKGNKIVNQGGKIVVCGTLTVDATDAMRKSLADFWSPSGVETITITSYDGTTNFRAKGAKLVLDTSEVGLCVEFDFPVTFDNITIEHKYNSQNGKSVDNGAIIAARGNRLTIGYNVNVIATDVNPDEESRVEMYPSLLGGHRWENSKSDNYVSVGSGQWAMVVGGDWEAGHTGNATIGINGGKIGTICGTTKATNSNSKHVFDGSVWIGLWAGEVDNVYVVGKPGMIWGDASIGLGGTKINGKVRATHPDYEGDEIQAWVFNYTDAQIDTEKVVGFESPVPATGSALPYLAIVATVSFVGAAALIVGKKKKAVKN